MDECSKDCPYDPASAPPEVGMHHCPDCGEMQIAKMPHLCYCDKCVDWSKALPLRKGNQIMKQIMDFVYGSKTFLVIRIIVMITLIGAGAHGILAGPPEEFTTHVVSLIAGSLIALGFIIVLFNPHRHLEP